MATMKKLATSTTMNNNRELPEEIWMEILVYLKANDLQNYKIVSKLWRSLITYPIFINSHLSLHRSRHQQQPDEILITTNTIPKPNNLVRRIQYHYYSLVNSDRITMMRQKELQLLPYHYNQQIPTTKLQALSLESSCEGLLLFQDKYNPQQLYISNPLTSMFKPLPPIRVRSVCRHWSLVRDARLNKYKVFGLVTQYRFTVLTLEEDTTLSIHWEFRSVTENSHLKDFWMVSQFLLFKNEELIWSTIDQYVEPGHAALECYSIYSINIETHLFNKIIIPPYILKVDENFSPDAHLKCNGIRHLLSEVNGSLCLTIVYQSKLEMFVLEDRLNCMWTKSHSVHLQSLLNRHYSFNSFFIDDICLVTMRGVDRSNLLDLVKVLIHHEDQLLLYDLKSQECRKIGFLEKDQKLCRNYMFHSNSLVSWD